MCGLVGVAGEIVHKDKEVFLQMLYADKLRGKDSTGIAALEIGPNKTFDWLKGPYSPEELYQFTRFNKIMNRGLRMLIGHNRASTVGNATTPNAHPFDCGNIIGAHNGTLTHSAIHELRRSLPKGVEPDGDTDSELLYLNMEHNGVAKTIKETTGAWALTWYDQKADTINFLRNSDRPLYYVFSESMKTVYWASEAGLLIWVLSRNDIKHKPIKCLPVDQWCKWGIPINSTQIFGDEEGSPYPLAGKPPAVYEGWRAAGSAQTRTQTRSGTSTPGTGAGVRSGDRIVRLEDFKKQAFEAGWDAFFSGLEENDNPHSVASIIGKSWKEGWSVANDFFTSGASDEERAEVLSLRAERLEKRLNGSKPWHETRQSMGTRSGYLGNIVTRDEWEKSNITYCYLTGKPVTFDSVGYFVDHDKFVLWANDVTLDRLGTEKKPRHIYGEELFLRKAFLEGFNNGYEQMEKNLDRFVIPQHIYHSSNNAALQAYSVGKLNGTKHWKALFPAEAAERDTTSAQTPILLGSS